MAQNNGLISAEEAALTRSCMTFALDSGAEKVRITLSKSTMDLFATLNGSLDKVTHCLDRVLSICLFVDGRYGSFSINRLEEDELKSFIVKAIDRVRMMAQDPCRDLPSPSRTEKGAVSGDELGLYDPNYENVTADKRLKLALSAAVFEKYSSTSDGYKLISEEGEYSDSVSDTLVVDSNGLNCRHFETSFDYGVEVSIEDIDGNKYSGYWWDSASTLAGLDISKCGDIAVKKAVESMNPVKIPGGRKVMVVDSEVAGKLVNPLVMALKGFSLQQKNSFLLDSLGKKLFGDGVTIMDECRCPGKGGSRLFDSEGVATKDIAIIDHGVVNEYFINTFIGKKMGIKPTVEDYTRLVVRPYLSSGSLEESRMISQKDILRLCGNGILVTGFNGGNNNSATGDFSYGIEGFAFEDGVIVGPVREMLITGNFISLWNHLIAAGTDSRPCKINAIPTLAFSDVDFSA
jgi:PmbA protein